MTTLASNQDRNGASPPLAGITVIDFSELLPGPFFTQSLAEMGATVIKIERPPAGDNVRRMGPGVFEAVNRGKRSLCADLKDSAQREKILALVDKADILVESYRPGVMARLGMDHAYLIKRCPHLIYVSLTGYGQCGPWANLPGHDINYMAVVGALSISGTPDSGPAQSFGLPVADLCGAMYALSATLAALYQRQKTGRGQHLDVAMADAVLHWMNPRLGAFREANAQTLQAQREVTLTKPAYGAFRCSDGVYVSVAALEDHFWERLCAALDMGQFGKEAYRNSKARKAHAAAINDRIAQELSTRRAAEVFALLAQRDIPVAPVVEPTQLGDVEQFTVRQRFDASTSAGQLPLSRFPVSLDGVDAAALKKAPALNEARGLIDAAEPACQCPSSASTPPCNRA